MNVVHCEVAKLAVLRRNSQAVENRLHLNVCRRVSHVNDVLCHDTSGAERQIGHKHARCAQRRLDDAQDLNIKRNGTIIYVVCNKSNSNNTRWCRRPYECRLMVRQVRSQLTTGLSSLNSSRYWVLVLSASPSV